MNKIVTEIVPATERSGKLRLERSERKRKRTNFAETKKWGKKEGEGRGGGNRYKSNLGFHSIYVEVFL